MTKSNNEPTVALELGNGKTVNLHHGMFINNEFVPSKSGKTLEVFNPAKGKVIGEIYQGDADDVDVAVKAARTAYEANNRAWGFGVAAQRAKLLIKLADLIDENVEELAALEATDTGKLYSDALTKDIPGTSATLRYFAGWADKLMGHTYNSVPGAQASTRLEPVGVCGQIIPWNFPGELTSYDHD